MNRDVFVNELMKILKKWQIELNLEYSNPKKNVRVSFGDIGSFGELSAINFNEDFIGSGSGGMGFDLLNTKTKKTIEVKTCCTIQNSKCSNESCGIKFNHLFNDTCPNCGSKEYKLINDSRFGINSKELIKQYKLGIFEKLVLCHISLVNQNKKFNELNIKIEFFEVDFMKKDEYLNIRLEYFNNQATKGRNTTANLLPYSYDFYKLTPLKIYEVDAAINYSDLNKEPTYCINDKKTPLRISEKEVRLYKSEKEKFMRLSTYDKKTKSACAKEFARLMPYRKKSLGKERGDTRESVYGILLD